MPTIRKQLTTDDLNMAQISQWLNDNQLPEGNTFLAPGSVGPSLIQQVVWQAFPFASGWSSLGGAFQVGQFGLDAVGFVHLRGVIQHPTAYAFPVTIGTLPVGARPSLTEMYHTWMFDATTGNVNARVDVGASGAVILQTSVPSASGSGLTFLSLSLPPFAQG